MNHSDRCEAPPVRPRPLPGGGRGGRPPRSGAMLATMPPPDDPPEGPDPTVVNLRPVRPIGLGRPCRLYRRDSASSSSVRLTDHQAGAPVESMGNAIGSGWQPEPSREVRDGGVVTFAASQVLSATLGRRVIARGNPIIG
jgi:hypothetical protein